MTFEELNRVRVLKKQVQDELQKIQALRDCAESITQKYSREILTCPQYPKIKKSYATLAVSPTGGVASSKVENFSVMILDSEKKIADLQEKIVVEVAELVEKIQRDFPNSIEQTILIYHYVLCKPLRVIANILQYSRGYVGNVHARILKVVMSMDTM